eukprot:jgi/Bigna1/90755/estExt_fgenesh1_pg.C_780075
MNQHIEGYGVWRWLPVGGRRPGLVRILGLFSISIAVMSTSLLGVGRGKAAVAASLRAGTAIGRNHGRYSSCESGGQSSNHVGRLRNERRRRQQGFASSDLDRSTVTERQRAALMNLRGGKRRDAQDVLSQQISKARDPIELMKALKQFLLHNVSIISPDTDPQYAKKFGNIGDIGQRWIAATESLEPSDHNLQEMTKNEMSLANMCAFLARLADFQRNDEAISKLAGGTYPGYKIPHKNLADKSERSAPWYIAIKEISNLILSDIYTSMLRDFPEHNSQSDKYGLPKPYIDSARSVADLAYAIGMLPMLYPNGAMPFDLVDVATNYALSEYDGGGGEDEEKGGLSGRYEPRDVARLLYGLSNVAKAYPTNEELAHQKQISPLEANKFFHRPLNASAFSYGLPLPEDAMTELMNILTEVSGSTNTGKMAAECLTPLESLQVLYGFAHLGYSPDESLVRLLQAKVVKSGLHKLSIRDLSEFGYALAKLSKGVMAHGSRREPLADPKTLAALDTAFARKLDRTTRMVGVADFLWALTEMKHTPSKKLREKVFGDWEAGPVQWCDTLMPERLGRLLTAMGRMRYFPEDFGSWHFIRVAIKKHTPIATLSDVVALMNGLADLDMCHRPDVEDWYNDDEERNMIFIREFEKPHKTTPLMENPQPYGVPSVSADQHLKLPAPQSLILLDSLKAFEVTAQRREAELSSSPLIPEILENLERLGFSVKESRKIGIYNVPAIATGDMREKMDDEHDLGKSEDGYKLAVLLCTDEDVAPSSSSTSSVVGGNRVGLRKVRELLMREKGYEPLLINVDEFNRVSGFGKRAQYIEGVVLKANVQAAWESRKRVLEEREREKGEPYYVNEFMDIVGKREDNNFPTLPNKNRLVSQREYLEEMAEALDRPFEEDEIPRKHLVTLVSNTNPRIGSESRAF